MSMVSIAIMSDAIWNLATGNTHFMESNQYPDNVIAPYVNWTMRAIISVMWLFLYGKSFQIIYNTGDQVFMTWHNWKYVTNVVITTDNIVSWNNI